MGMLLWLAALPPLFLLYKVYKLDTIEREPVKLIAVLLAAGGLTTIVAGVLETACSFLYTWTPNVYLSHFIQFFIVVAIAEEGVKYLALRKLSWNHPAFDFTFDGVVYAVSVSLGFALVENIMYVGMYGVSTAVIRAFTAIILHGICGIFLGIYYGMAKRQSVAGDERGASALINRGFLIAVLTHGMYDFCASMGTEIWTGIFFVFLIILEVIAYRKIKEFQKIDMRVDGFGDIDFRR